MLLQFFWHFAAALNLIRTLREKGHEVRVVCPDADRAGEPGYYIVPKYDFHIFNEYVEKNGVAPAKLDTRVPEAAIHDVDVIHVMIPFALGKAAAHYAHDHGIALTAGFHCQAENITNHISLQNSPKANTAVYHILYDRLYRYCDCIHYPTQFIKDTFEAIVGPTNGRVISNPDAVSLPFLQTLVTMLGVIPIPNKFSGMRQFLSSVQQRYRENNVIAIFPEAHIWPFYTGIRPVLGYLLPVSGKAGCSRGGHGHHLSPAQGAWAAASPAGHDHYLVRALLSRCRTLCPGGPAEAPGSGLSLYGLRGILP